MGVVLAAGGSASRGGGGRAGRSRRRRAMGARPGGLARRLRLPRPALAAAHRATAGAARASRTPARGLPVITLCIHYTPPMLIYPHHILHIPLQLLNKTWKL